MSKTLIQLRGVSKNYTRAKQSIQVLDKLDLDIAEGEFLALMGPSGSGKTTLLNLIGGLDQPTTGSVNIDGTPIEALSSNRLAAWRARNVGFVFQFYNLMPVLTAERNVELPLLLTNLSAAQRKKNVAIALEVVGLADRAHHKPKELSGGQEQRYRIAWERYRTGVAAHEWQAVEQEGVPARGRNAAHQERPGGRDLGN